MFLPKSFVSSADAVEICPPNFYVLFLIKCQSRGVRHVSLGKPPDIGLRFGEDLDQML